MRKYGISDPCYTLYYNIVDQKVSHNKGLCYGFRDAILSHLVTMHQVPGTYMYIVRYTVYPGRVSCPFYAIPTYSF